MKPDASPSSDPFSLSDALVEALAARSPMAATSWGIPGRDDAWDDLSPEGHAAMRQCLAEFEARIPVIPAEADRWTRLAAHVLSDFLRMELDRIDQGDPFSDLNHIASPFQQLQMTLNAMDASTPEGAASVAARVARLPEALAGYQRSLARGLAEGRVVAARQVRAVAGQAATCAGERSYLHKLAPVAGDAVTGACAAYGRFGRWLEEDYLPHARQADGVGRARYAREARRFLGMDLDLEATYAWGWTEVASLTEQMRACAAEIDANRSVEEVLALLKVDPARSAPDVDSFLDEMRARQQQALHQLAGTHFDVPEPVRTIQVKQAPVGGPIGVYYDGPSEGFRRPGCVWYSLGEPRAVPRFDHICTAYHEGFPGHHLQIGIQVSLADRLSRLHRIGYGCSGYAEGWALYAEQLMDELGYYEIPDYRLGFLAGQLIRAARVVIDIGSHLALPIPENQDFYPGKIWSYEIGVEMLVRLGGLQADRAGSEMTRYLGWPGQAISYKVGHRVMRELRAEAMQRRGAGFDLKAFHAEVLGCGNVGLEHLRRLVLDDAERGAR